MNIIFQNKNNTTCYKIVKMKEIYLSKESKEEIEKEILELQLHF